MIRTVVLVLCDLVQRRIIVALKVVAELRLGLHELLPRLIPIEGVAGPLLEPEILPIGIVEPHGHGGHVVPVILIEVYTTRPKKINRQSLLLPFKGDMLLLV